MLIRFTRSARKHRIGKGHALFVIGNVEPEFIEVGRFPDDQYVWIGTDDRGVELEIVAVIKPDCLLVIHVMPTHLRRRS